MNSETSRKIHDEVRRYLAMSSFKHHGVAVIPDDMFDRAMKVLEWQNEQLIGMGLQDPNKRVARIQFRGTKLYKASEVCRMLLHLGELKGAINKITGE